VDDKRYLQSLINESEHQQQDFKYLSKLPRHKVITLLARLIRFHVARWKYTNQQFLFYIE